MGRHVLIAVDDLIFLSKIRQTAQQAGIALEVTELSKIESRIKDAPHSSLIIDLNHHSGAAVDHVRALKSDPATSSVQVAGFLSHVQGELAAAARQAGCDLVMARSAFARQLPELLSKLAE